MKVRTEIVNRSEFNPINIVVTIESKEELCELWHRFNLACYEVARASNLDTLPWDKSSDTSSVWKELDDLVIEKNLKIVEE